MPEELGVRDVIEQLDTRLGNLEQGQRDLRGEMVTRFVQVDSRFDQVRAEINSRFTIAYALLGTTLVGVVGLAVGMAGLWAKL